MGAWWGGEGKGGVSVEKKEDGLRIVVLVRRRMRRCLRLC
jgi:hypothetical protein